MFSGFPLLNLPLLFQVVVPAMVMAKFLSVAQTNTSNNVETCAILAGKLARDSFRITHILVPKQSGTSDSCSTSNEEAIFEYQVRDAIICTAFLARNHSGGFPALGTSN
jgi:STAM-binding protein